MRAPDVPPAGAPVGEGRQPLVGHHLHAEVGAVPGAVPGGVRDDLEPADLVPVDLVVIAAIGVQVLDAAQMLAALAADRQDGLDQRISRVTSLRLPPVVRREIVSSVVSEGDADCGRIEYHLVLGVAVCLPGGHFGSASRADKVETVTASGALAAADQSHGVGVPIGPKDVVRMDDEAGGIAIELVQPEVRGIGAAGHPRRSCPDTGDLRWWDWWRDFDLGDLSGEGLSAGVTQEARHAADSAPRDMPWPAVLWLFTAVTGVRASRSPG